MVRTFHYPVNDSHFYLFIVFQGVPDDNPQTLFHAPLDLQHPVLHIPCRVQGLHKGHVLSLRGVHPGDFKIFLKLQLQPQNNTRFRLSSQRIHKISKSD